MADIASALQTSELTEILLSVLPSTVGGEFAGRGK